MRIISGKYRGKVIHPGKDFSSRPTTDFAKESLFDILSNRFDFEDVEVLDLFSGTGSISYEFASRGSRYIEAVEMSQRHASFIIRTAQSLAFNNLKVVRTNVFLYLKMCRKKFDIIFADPPFDMEGIETLPEIIMAGNFLNENGVFILEHPRSIDFSNHTRLLEHRNYGSVQFSFFH